jgi:hypothetical protein
MNARPKSGRRPRPVELVLHLDGRRVRGGRRGADLDPAAVPLTLDRELLGEIDGIARRRTEQEGRHVSRGEVLAEVIRAGVAFIEQEHGIRRLRLVQKED